MGQKLLYSVILILLVQIKSHLSQQLYLEKGSLCSSSNGDMNGRCTYIKECPTAIYELRMLKKKPIICSFQGLVSVICCKEQNDVISTGNHSYFVQSEGDVNVRFNTSSTMNYKEECDSYKLQMITLSYRTDIEKHTNSTENDKPFDPHNEIATVTPPIVGGTRADFREFPHMALIGFGSANNKSWNCGGTLISKQFVLTAAHCLYISGLGDAKFVRLGELELGSGNRRSAPRDFNVSDMFVHPDYKPPILYNDIALLKLDSNVTFSADIFPACLFDRYVIPVTKAIATGWGDTEYHGSPSDHLLKVSLDIYSHRECFSSYNNSLYTRHLPRGIDDSTQLCSGEEEGGRDTCQGDSGGPLQFRSEDIYYILGITSSGAACALRHSPGIYTRVSAYVHWIESIVWH